MTTVVSGVCQHLGIALLSSIVFCALIVCTMIPADVMPYLLDERDLSFFYFAIIRIFGFRSYRASVRNVGKSAILNIPPQLCCFTVLYASHYRLASDLGQSSSPPQFTMSTLKKLLRAVIQ
ncbi:hypothetical protein F5B22DRAFT_80780 [Xylaria bambusicola]|uniref:uncharacterized protein n=1 Tax=Xylaria bambusicola TaxID=326684 RepID=UPI0020086307|nr:uncharacterized protein F5B22DRAFT_80780 [Xylaria bambusicola]KAI0518321.1 hypothetical protein F5B22DRAFT_80780 [Xylaria bambusicola]